MTEAGGSSITASVMFGAWSGLLLPGPCGPDGISGRYSFADFQRNGVDTSASAAAPPQGAVSGGL